jgi:NADPH-dependent 2,4-dienoyl-CoA reductase/sulfur reductase-like enzyme
MRGDRYWASVLDPHESAMVEARVVHEGVQLHTNTELASVEAAKGRVAAVITRSGERLACDMLAVAIGIAPRIGLAKDAGLATGRGIWTDASLRTSDPDIYAAGDVAEVLAPAGGQRTLDSLWSVANAHGRIAGINMTGGSEVYQRPAPFNVTKVGGIMTTLIGAVGTGGREGDLVTLARGDSSFWRERLDGFAVAADAGDNHVRLVLGSEHILGAVVMGDQTLSWPLQHAIRERWDISTVRERLLTQPGAVGQLLAELAGDREGTVPVGAL